MPLFFPFPKSNNPWDPGDREAGGRKKSRRPRVRRQSLRLCEDRHGSCPTNRTRPSAAGISFERPPLGVPTSSSRTPSSASAHVQGNSCSSMSTSTRSTRSTSHEPGLPRSVSSSCMRACVALDPRPACCREGGEGNRMYEFRGVCTRVIPSDATAPVHDDLGTERFDTRSRLLPVADSLGSSHDGGQRPNAVKYRIHTCTKIKLKVLL